MNANLKKIVYVEDEDDIRVVGEMALQLGNWEIISCSSGQEAVSAVLQHQPDLVILDVMMPGMDGPATLKAIQGNPKISNIPVIFMTAKVQANEIEHFKKLGVVAVISKPFNPMTLAENIKKICQST